MSLQVVSSGVQEALAASAAYVQDNKAVAAIAAVGSVAGIAYWLSFRKGGYHSKPTGFELSVSAGCRGMGWWAGMRLP